MPAIVTMSDVRIDGGGFPAIDGMTLATTGDRVLVLGAARALFEAAAGLRSVARGDLRIGGLAPVDAIRSGHAACAPLDPPLPPTWTAFQYVAWSARLAGHPRATARALAEDALGRLQLTSISTVKLRRAETVSRRGVVVAAALATGATTLLVEDPLGGLSDESARTFARALSRAFQDRRTALFAPRLPLQSPLALHADEALVVTGSQVAIQGAPAEIAAAERSFSLRVHGDAEAFIHAVELSGGRVVVTSSGALPREMRVDLGRLATRDLLRIANGMETTVLELRALARVFA